MAHVSDHLAQGEGRTFRNAGPLEKLAAAAGRHVGNGRVRAVLGRAFEGALWAATGGRGVRALLPHGEVVRLAPRFRGTSWNPEEYEAFRSATRPGDVVIDAGANTGAYTLLFAQWVGPRGRVFAFEPVPSVAAALRAHLELNKVGDRVTVVQAALAETAGVAIMTAPGTRGINRRAVRNDPPRDLVSVETTSLDAFCDRQAISPAVIKIDVEGAELDVLRGARRVLASTPRPHLFVEFHPSLWPAFGLAPEDLQRELRLQGLHARPLCRADDPWGVEGICASLVPGSG